MNSLVGRGPVLLACVGLVGADDGEGTIGWASRRPGPERTVRNCCVRESFVPRWLAGSGLRCLHDLPLKETRNKPQLIS
jgi:hypothetical protein